MLVTLRKTLSWFCLDIGQRGLRRLRFLVIRIQVDRVFVVTIKQRVVLGNDHGGNRVVVGLDIRQNFIVVIVGAQGDDTIVIVVVVLFVIVVDIGLIRVLGILGLGLRLGFVGHRHPVATTFQNRFGIKGGIAFWADNRGLLKIIE